MQVKDRYLEKINFFVLVFILCFSHNVIAEDTYEKIFNYNETLKNSSVKFIQTNSNYLQEGEIFFGNKRIKINYRDPQKITIILSEKKGMYTNHELQESEFFMTQKSYIRNFFDVFYKKNHMKNMDIKKSVKQIEISESIQLENVLFNIKITYEKDPVKLRRIEIISNDQEIQMGFFDHKNEDVFDKNFFSMIDPYLN